MLKRLALGLVAIPFAWLITEWLVETVLKVTGCGEVFGQLVCAWGDDLWAPNVALLTLLALVGEVVLALPFWLWWVWRAGGGRSRQEALSKPKGGPP